MAYIVPRSNLKVKKFGRKKLNRYICDRNISNEQRESYTNICRQNIFCFHLCYVSNDDDDANASPDA
jgi:hypothetical protein